LPTRATELLVLIGEVDLLARLYGEVLIPDVVAQELSDPEGPLPVARWASHLPPWISVRPTPVSTERFDRLDAGERAAILLAEAQTSSVLLLIDEANGRAEAARRHISTTGTLGILRAASIRGLTDLPTALGLLGATNFRCAAVLFDQLWAEDTERKRGPARL
jgi:predicted nucleic acid-binding protein